MILKHTFNSLGFHLTAPVIDNLRTSVLWQVKDVLVNKAFFKEIFGF
jgi:hypothetical protein